MCNSPLPTNTSKIHLHVIHHIENELETGKDSYTTKTMKKILMEVGRKGREVIRSGPVLLGGYTKEKEDLPGTEQFEPHIECPEEVQVSSRMLQRRRLCVQ